MTVKYVNPGINGNASTKEALIDDKLVIALSFPNMGGTGVSPYTFVPT